MPDELQYLFPPGVIALGAQIEEWQGELHQAEVKIIHRAAAKRRREFTAGRLCAREALLRLGIFSQPVLTGKDREPLWPRDVVGSITHCDDYCAAAIGRMCDYSGLGLDVEPAEPLDDDMIELVCTPDELASLDDLHAAERHLWPKVLFSAKESVYKCIFPAARVFLDFHDIRIRREDTSGRFNAEILKPLPRHQSSPVTLKGRYTLTSSHLFTAVASGVDY